MRRVSFPFAALLDARTTNVYHMYNSLIYKYLFNETAAHVHHNRQLVSDHESSSFSTTQLTVMSCHVRFIAIAECVRYVICVWDHVHHHVGLACHL